MQSIFLLVLVTSLLAVPGIAASSLPFPPEVPVVTWAAAVFGVRRLKDYAFLGFLRAKAVPHPAGFSAAASAGGSGWAARNSLSSPALAGSTRGGTATPTRASASSSPARSPTRTNT